MDIDLVYVYTVPTERTSVYTEAIEQTSLCKSHDLDTMLHCDSQIQIFEIKSIMGFVYCLPLFECQNCQN